jgi:hypothetical protein
MTRGRGFLWLFAGLISAAPSVAAGQNLDAGKPPAQIFQEACAGCHRNAHALRSGATTSFLREHYTTGSGMAAAMANYLAGGSSDPRATLPQAQRPPKGPAPADGVISQLLRGLVPADATPRPPRGLVPVDANPRPTATAAETREPVPPSKPQPPPLEEFEE